MSISKLPKAVVCTLAATFLMAACGPTRQERWAEMHKKEIPEFVAAVKSRSLDGEGRISPSEGQVQIYDEPVSAETLSTGQGRGIVIQDERRPHFQFDPKTNRLCSISFQASQNIYGGTSNAGLDCFEVTPSSEERLSPGLRKDIQLIRDYQAKP